MKLQKETGVAAGAEPEAQKGRKHGKWYDDACGTAFALELVGERWSLLIVRELMFGPRRFSDLRAGLPGISAKVLTERLESLEAAKIVQRRQLPSPSSAHVYELTPWGYSAETAIKELGRWAATSPDHDHTLPLSPASFMLSLRTMFDPARAGDAAVAGAIHIGREHFTVRVADGALDAQRGEMDAPQFVIAAPNPSPMAYAIYDKLPFAGLAGMGLEVSGDQDAALRFADCFYLPGKAVV